MTPARIDRTENAADSYRRLESEILALPEEKVGRVRRNLDVGSWLEPKDTGLAKRTPGVVFSVAHLEDEERTLVLGLLLDEVLSWARTLPGTRQLRALVAIDEVFGLLPPHPANPPTKGPIVSLMKQARAYGVGVVLATQNPMDLDYRSGDVVNHRDQASASAMCSRQWRRARPWVPLGRRGAVGVTRAP